MARVLVVDDAQTDRELAGRVVKSMGRELSFAEDGAQAVAKAREVQPDLILMDVVMPGQDGYATCRKLKKDPETKSIPVVMVSSKGEESDKLWAMRQGADGYLVKPFDAEAMAEFIEKFA